MLLCDVTWFVGKSENQSSSERCGVESSIENDAVERIPLLGHCNNTAESKKPIIIDPKATQTHLPL
jgi:hypothetical protein